MPDMIETDYLVVGGGLTGCVVATRLKEYQPNSRVTLLEAGENEHANPLMIDPMGTFQLHLSKYEYNYKTVPQAHYDGRQVFNAGGRVLSGSTSCNYAMWTRGDKEDYDVWGNTVNDKRWSYAGLLPYMRKTETHFASDADPQVHGFNGPIHTTPADRPYPLREPLRESYQSMGIAENKDGNSGSPNGFATYVENWYQAKRQPAGKAYGLAGVDVRTGSVVKSLLLSKGSDGQLEAKGAELVNGTKFHASKEVILSCGAIRTPQILMLSGVGPTEQLSKHGIAQVLESPEVGKNFFDHLSVAQFYKVRKPELGLCAGSPAYHARDPSFADGIPVSWVVLESVDKEELAPALTADGHDSSHPLLARPRNPIEHVIVFAPTEAPYTNLNVPFDGTCITAGALNLLPTSRGSVTLASTNPEDDPLIDPNYFATETDKVIIRRAMRRVMQSIETPAMKEYIGEEFTPEGCPALNSKSSDADLDARIRRAAATWFHPMGSCSMGKVVDNDLRFMGVRSLRVIDASVVPVPIAAHSQVPLYALAEQAAELIAGKQV